MALDNIISNYMLVNLVQPIKDGLDCAYRFNKVQLFGTMFYTSD